MRPTPELQRPPRSVPFFLGLQCLFGVGLQQLGWGLTAFGMVFVFFLGTTVQLPKELAFYGETAQVDGLIKGYRETNVSINETEVVEYLVEYQVGEAVYQHTFFVTGYRFDEEDSVKVEYPVDRPGWGRAVGGRTSAFSPWILLMVVIPLLGLWLVYLGLRQGWKNRALLSRGKLARATFVSKEETNVEINERTVYEFTFRFLPEGAHREFTTTARTHLTENLQDDEQELLLYDPLFPPNAVLLDNLPGKAEIDARGRLVGGNVLAAMAGLILPSWALGMIALTVSAIS